MTEEGQVSESIMKGEKRRFLALKLPGWPSHLEICNKFPLWPGLAWPDLDAVAYP